MTAAVVLEFTLNTPKADLAGSDNIQQQRQQLHSRKTPALLQLRPQSQTLPTQCLAYSVRPTNPSRWPHTCSCKADVTGLSNPKPTYQAEAAVAEAVWHQAALYRSYTHAACQRQGGAWAGRQGAQLSPTLLCKSPGCVPCKNARVELGGQPVCSTEGHAPPVPRRA